MAELFFFNQNPIKIKDIQELTLTILIRDFLPEIVTPEVLSSHSIIPKNWQLKQKPQINSQLLQLTFTNKVQLVAQIGKISFIQPIGTKITEDLEVIKLASNYVAKMPSAKYQSLHIQPRRIVSLPEAEGGKKYIAQTLLNYGPHLELGQISRGAKVDLLYQLKRCQLDLTIMEAKLEMADKNIIPGLFFGGKFIYYLNQYFPQENVSKLNQLLSNTPKDMDTFRKIIHQKFLG